MTVAALCPYPMKRSSPLDPSPDFASMRAASTLTRARLDWDGSVVWLVTRYDDARQVLGDARFSSDFSKPGFPARLTARHPGPGTFIRMDAPDHLRLRKLVVGEFNRQRVDQLRPVIQRIVDELIDEFTAGTPPVDLVAEFALPLPSRVITEVLGVPYEDHPFFYEITKVIGDQRATDLEYRLKVRNELWAYMDKLLRAKESSPTDDLLSRLAVRRAEANVSRDEVVGIVTLLIIAGYETVANQLGVGTVVLLAHPEQLAQLRADPELLPVAIEEILRHQTVLDYGARRVATEDVDVGGQLIRAGEGVVVVMSAANRDEHVFADPDQLDIHREAHENLAFGYGPHQCVGQILARAQLRLAWQTLFRRLPTLRLAIPMAELPFRYDMFVYGVNELPVAW